MIRSELKRTMPTEPKRRMKVCDLSGCYVKFERKTEEHRCCCPEHAEQVVVAERKRKERSERQEGLRKLMKRADHIKEAQAAFNAWVRYRDRDQPCICCGKFSTSEAGVGGRWDAGHYLSRGSHPHLRFDERNVFKQRKGCNRPGGTTAASFRIGVIARIGLAAVEALESDCTARKWSIEELIEIKQHYRAKLKELKGKS